MPSSTFGEDQILTHWMCSSVEQVHRILMVFTETYQRSVGDNEEEADGMILTEWFYESGGRKIVYGRQ